MPSPAGKTARRSRPSYLAAPPLLSESEPFEGAAVIREHPGPVGVVLWKSLRDVAAWTGAAPGARAALFNPAAAAARPAEVAAAEPELWAPLLVIGRLLENAEEVDFPRLVNACRAIARWGEQRGHGAVQLAFTQAAACLAPEHPRLAYAVGRLARDRGEYARAETWLRASIRLARNRDWHTYALSHLSLGTLYHQLGNLPAARTLTTRGYRASTRRRVRSLQGMALHHLFVIAAEMLDFGPAHEYALAAGRRYGPGHARFPVLVHDVGCFWMLHGRFGRACDVFQLVLGRIQAPHERLMALGTLARAAAADGRRTECERSTAEALELLARETVPPAWAAQGWLNLARAAATRGDRAQARSFGGRAREIASTLRLGQIEMEVEALLQAVERATAAAVLTVEPTVPGLWDPRADEVAHAIYEMVLATAP